MFFLSPKTYHLKPTQKGFTLVETLVGIFIFSIISLGIYQGYLNILELAKAARVKGLAALVANNTRIVMLLKMGLWCPVLRKRTGCEHYCVIPTVRTIGGNPTTLRPIINGMVAARPKILMLITHHKNLEGLFVVQCLIQWRLRIYVY